MKNLTATLVVALACTALQAQKPRTAASAPQTSVVLRGGKLLTIKSRDGDEVLSPSPCRVYSRRSYIKAPQFFEYAALVYLG